MLNIYGFSFKTITFTNTSFIRNRAREGGGVYVENNYTVSFLGSTFSGNTAVLDGGGINIHHYLSINIIRGDKTKKTTVVISMYWYITYYTVTLKTTKQIQLEVQYQHILMAASRWRCHN